MFFCIHKVYEERSRILIQYSSQGDGTGDPDPHSHQNVTDPNTARVRFFIVLSGFLRVLNLIFLLFYFL